MEKISPSQGIFAIFEASAPYGRKLLDRVSDAIRVKHYSLRTEKTYKDWIVRYILFHKKRHPKDMGPEEIQAFITHLAVERHLAASSQNQALSAIMFLYRHVLQKEIDLPSDLIQAEKSKTLPVVLTHQEAISVIGKTTGTPQLMAKILYGSGLRLMECLRLRVKDIDFGNHQTCTEPVEVSSSVTAKAKTTASPRCPTRSSPTWNCTFRPSD